MHPPISPRLLDILDRALAGGRLPHALLFHGQAGSFIGPAARYVCQSLHGTDKTLVDHLDIRPEKSLGIDRIKTLQERIKYGPASQPQLTVILYDCHLMTLGAANAFLKTLEEPPEGVMFILLTPQLHDVLPTIQSRCHILAFPPVSIETIVTAIQAHPDRDEAGIAVCQGQIDLLAQYLETGDLMDSSQLISLAELQKKSLCERLSFAQELSTSPQSIPIVLNKWCSDAIEIPPPSQGQSPSQLLIENILQMKYNLNARLQLERLVMEL